MTHLDAWLEVQLGLLGLPSTYVEWFINSFVVKKEDEEWIRLHPQTLHTYRLPDKPCWIAVYIKNETHFLKRVESVQA